MCMGVCFCVFCFVVARHALCTGGKARSRFFGVAWCGVSPSLSVRCLGRLPCVVVAPKRPRAHSLAHREERWWWHTAQCGARTPSSTRIMLPVGTVSCPEARRRRRAPGPRFVKKGRRRRMLLPASLSVAMRFCHSLLLSVNRPKSPSSRARTRCISAPQRGGGGVWCCYKVVVVVCGGGTAGPAAAAAAGPSMMITPSPPRRRRRRCCQGGGS